MQNGTLPRNTNSKIMKKSCNGTLKRLSLSGRR
jgi:hypothetical protein